MVRPASRVLLADARPDASSRAVATLAFGFEREGVETIYSGAGEEVVRLISESKPVDCVVLSTSLASGDPIDVMKRIRAAAPSLAVLVVGDADKREAMVAAGATDFIGKPAYVRDVVTLARLLPAQTKDHGGAIKLAGDLDDTRTLFHVMRALSAAQRTGVMMVARGSRRGELRYFAGEVTSASVAALHGLAALHQLLLWPEGRFDFRAENVVRRQQIPLSPGELVEDAERFLRDFGDLAGSQLDPGAILEQDLRKVATEKIPKEVAAVVRLFDGRRAFVDVIEDSPFRVVETVKIALRLLDLGVIVPATDRSERAKAALAVEDWLVGVTPPIGVPVTGPARESERIGPRPGEPAAPPPAAAPAPHAKKKSRSAEMAAANSDGVPVPTSNWGAEPSGPAPAIWEQPGFAPVVPSRNATGEIEVIRFAKTSGAIEEAEQVLRDLPPIDSPASAPTNGTNGAAHEPAENLKVADGPPETPKPAPPAEAKTVNPDQTRREKKKKRRGSEPPSKPAIALVPEAAKPAEPAPPPKAPPVDDSATIPNEKLDVAELLSPVPPPAATAKPEPEPAPPPPPASKPAELGDVVKAAAGGSAHHFEDLEESFFSQEETFQKAPPPPESFADLDEGEPPPLTFWERLFGRKKTAAPPRTPAGSGSQPKRPGSPAKKKK
jgi:DNA-binding response OmpR family regulator